MEVSNFIGKSGIYLSHKVVLGCSNERKKNGDNNEGDDGMFENKKICKKCKTGKYFYELDPKSDTCPYIACWKQNKCPFYKPLDKTSKIGFFRRLINKKSPTLTKK
ncbi:MAG: hypothetical protein J6R68_05565 [Clostridia bacterium]|nr:hypothetical protein [Clostridia bacterium]